MSLTLKTKTASSQEANSSHRKFTQTAAPNPFLLRSRSKNLNEFVLIDVTIDSLNAIISSLPDFFSFEHFVSGVVGVA
jgi:hypothetical protein